jgi:hypothetical protein
MTQKCNGYAVTRPALILEVPISNLGRDTDYLNWSCRSFHQIQQMTGIILK